MKPSIRVALFLLLMVSCSAFSSEVMVSDVRRSEIADAVFTGRVTNVQRASASKANVGADEGNLWGTLWRAEVEIEAATKGDVPVGKKAVVYFCRYGVKNPDGKVSEVVSTQPGPKIEEQMKATFWCKRSNVAGRTGVLYVPSQSWVK
jgi:hypothetical protein